MINPNHIIIYGYTTLLMRKYNIYNKHLMSYAEWVERYKGKQIDEVVLESHKVYLKQFKAWQIGNMEKI